MIEPELSSRQRRWRKRLQIALSAFYLLPFGLGIREFLAGSLFSGTLLTVVFGILFILSLRRTAFGSDFVEHGPNAGDIAPPYFDLIVVSVLLIPIIAIGFLVLTLLKVI